MYPVNLALAEILTVLVDEIRTQSLFCFILFSPASLLYTTANMGRALALAQGGNESQVVKHVTFLLSHPTCWHVSNPRRANWI